MSALFDTSLLLDYLNGVREAAEVCESHKHRAITVLTWAEILAAAPAGVSAETREFLRGFERLATNEAIADRALELTLKYKALTLRHALPWATAESNRLVYVTVDAPLSISRASGILVPYRRAIAVEQE